MMAWPALKASTKAVRWPIARPIGSALECRFDLASWLGAAIDFRRDQQAQGAAILPLFPGMSD